MDKADTIHFYATLLKLIDGSIRDDEVRSLELALRNSEEVRRSYSEFMQEYLLTTDLVGTMNMEENTASLRQLFDGQVWTELAQHEKIAPELVVEAPKAPKEPSGKSRRSGVQRRIGQASLVLGIASVAALFVIVVGALLLAPSQALPCGVLVDSVNAQWGDGAEPIAIGATLYNQEEGYTLTSGIARIRFDYGAEVIIEGPASFACQTGEELFLRRGRAYAYVPMEATGFSVNTPSSKIVDLGTEFGVQVSADRATEVHMLKGKAAVIPGSRGRKGVSMNLEGGRAARVDTTGQVEHIELEEDYFVRQISSATGTVWRGDQICPTDGLIIHLRADSLSLNDGDPVTVWPDSTTGDRADGTVKVDPGVSVPTFKANAYNGLPAVHFNGPAKQALMSDQWSWSKNNGVTLVILCTGGNDSIDRVVHVGDIGGAVARSFAADVSSNSTGDTETGSGVRFNNGYSLTGAAVSNPIVKGQWHVGIRHISTGMRHEEVFYSVDSVKPLGPLVSNEPFRTLNFARDGNVIAVGNGRLQGNWIGIRDWYDGDVAEVLVYNKKLTTDEMRTVLRYFQDKYDHRLAGRAAGMPRARVKSSR